jgi:hypothetical protein
MSPLIYPTSSLNLNTIWRYKQKLESHKNGKLSSSSISLTQLDHDLYFYNFLGQKLHTETMKFMESTYKKNLFRVMENGNKSLPTVIATEITKHFASRNEKKEEQLPDSTAQDIKQRVLQTNPPLHTYYAMQWSLSSKEQQDHWPIEDLVMSICDLVKYLNQSSVSQTRARFLSADNGMSIIKAIKCIQFLAENTRSSSLPILADGSDYFTTVDPITLVKKGKEFYTMWDIQEYRTKVSTSFIDEYIHYITITYGESFSDVTNYFGKSC